MCSPPCGESRKFTYAALRKKSMNFLIKILHHKFSFLSNCLFCLCFTSEDGVSSKLKQFSVNQLPPPGEQRPPSPPGPPPSASIFGNSSDAEAQPSQDFSPAVAAALLQLISQQDSEAGTPKPKEDPSPAGDALARRQGPVLWAADSPPKPPPAAEAPAGLVTAAPTSAAQFPKDQDLRFSHGAARWPTILRTRNAWSSWDILVWGGKAAEERRGADSDSLDQVQVENPMIENECVPERGFFLKSLSSRVVRFFQAVKKKRTNIWKSLREWNKALGCSHRSVLKATVILLSLKSMIVMCAAALPSNGAFQKKPFSQNLRARFRSFPALWSLWPQWPLNDLSLAGNFFVCLFSRVKAVKFSPSSSGTATRPTWGIPLAHAPNFCVKASL